MTFARCALLVPVLATVALVGCQPRQYHSKAATDEVVQSENAAEAERLSVEVARLRGENGDLQQRLLKANEALAKSKEAPTPGQQLAKKLKGNDIDGMTETASGGLSLSDDFAFAKGSDELSADGKKSIEKLAERLKTGEYANSKVVVEGHTDSSPVARASTKEKFHDNWGLSGARAASVVRALEAAGIAPKRLKGQFHGEHAPRGEDKAANRRVEIFLAD